MMFEKLESFIDKNRKWTTYGKVATYIPQLGLADPSLLGISIVDTKGNSYSAGDIDYKFTLQSITKVITLMVALLENGIQVFEHVGMEPTGDPFNSIVKLETIQPSIPLNPMINAGAISTVSLISGTKEERFGKILGMVQRLANNNQISYNERIFNSENETGDLNRALAYFMKNHGVIHGDINAHLEVYFKQSSIEVTTKDVANIAAIIANNGLDLKTGVQLVPHHIIKIVKTFMVTCGMYNESGEFAIRVGIPAKSGVGGGILAVVPGKYGIGIIGPALNEKGNSMGGVKLLEDLSQEYDLSIF